MNTRLRGSLAAVAAVLVVALAGVVVPATPASAATIGTLELRDALGRPLPSIDAAKLPGFTTAVATGACPVGFRDATRLAIVAGGSTFVASSNQAITDATAPAAATFDTAVSDYSTAGTLTVRLQCLDVQNGIGVVSASYFESTLTAGGAGVYAVSPAPAIVVEATSVSLAVSPVSPAVVGSSVTLTATVARAAIAGSVEFFDGATSLGSVSTTGGTASFASSAFGLGLHPFTAVFTPAEPIYYAPSTTAGPTLITIIERPTSTTLALDPPATVTVGTPAVLTARVSPSMAGGTVVFSAGTARFGSAPVVGGVATLSTTGLAAGEYDVDAAFTPTSPLQFEASVTTSSTRLVVQAAAVPTPAPTAAPTPAPTVSPTAAPTAAPSAAPTPTAGAAATPAAPVDPDGVLAFTGFAVGGVVLVALLLLAAGLVLLAMRRRRSAQE